MSAQFDTVAIWIQAFIPMASVKAVTSCYSGDDRDFSSDHDETRYRARSEIIVSGFLSQAPETTEFHQCGESHRVDCDSGEIEESETASTESMSFHHFSVGNTFADPEGGVVDNPNALCANFLYDGVTNNPLILSPDIDIALFFTIDPEGRTVSVRGAVNAFPDYEAYVSIDEGPAVILFQKRHSLEPLDGLPGGADQTVSAMASV